MEATTVGGLNTRLACGPTSTVWVTGFAAGVGSVHHCVKGVKKVQKKGKLTGGRTNPARIRGGVHGVTGRHGNRHDRGLRRGRGYKRRGRGTRGRRGGGGSGGSSSSGGGTTA